MRRSAIVILSSLMAPCSLTTDFTDGLQCRTDADCFDYVCVAGACREPGGSAATICRDFPWDWRSGDAVVSDTRYCTRPCTTQSECASRMCNVPGQSSQAPCECIAAPPPWGEVGAGYCALSRDDPANGTTWTGWTCSCP